LKKFIQLLACSACVQLSVHATDPFYQTAAITAPAKFEERDSFIWLVLDDAKRHYEMPWATSPRDLGIVALESNRVYNFTIEQEIKELPGVKWPSGSAFTMTNETVVKVQMGGKTIYDHEMCEVHKARMEPKVAFIAYGLVKPGPDEPPYQTANQLFPHFREILYGGCCHSSDSPGTDRIYVCNECKAAYQKWKDAHKQSTK